jgi:hypothetical protein
MRSSMRASSIESGMAFLEHGVEPGQAELVAQRGLRLLAIGHPCGVADLVAARLADHRAVALDLALAARLGEAGLFHHVGGRLLAAPAIVVNAGVDHQAHRAEQERLEIAGALDPVIAAQFIAQLLGIERPALAIGGNEVVAQDPRQFAAALGIAALEVMAGNALVIGERGQRIFRPVVHRLEIDPVDRRARPIERGAVVIAVGRAILDVGGHRADHQRIVGNVGKGARQLFAHGGNALVEPGNQVGAALRRIGIELVGGAVER